MNTTGVPLPPNPYHTTAHFAFNQAYETCLSLEGRHDRVVQSGVMKVLVCARFLGRMVLEAPQDEGREYFASEVSSRCHNDEELQGLAEIYAKRILCLRKSKFKFFQNHCGQCRRGTATSHFAFNRFASPPSTPSDEDKATQNALVRDLHRCMISGIIDTYSIEDGLIVDDGKTPFTSTRATHIFDITNNEKIENAKQKDYTASVIALLHRFGGINAMEELNGSHVHRLQNILTLNANLDTWFHELKIWLERDPMDPPNRYKLCSIHEIYHRELPAVVTLTTPDPLTLPLPDPRYLALHAACARVLHLSGAREFIW